MIEAPPGAERRRHAMALLDNARCWRRAALDARRKGRPRMAAQCAVNARNRLALARHYDAAARLLEFFLPGHR